MSRICKNQVIVLKQMPFSESDLIIRALTRKGVLISLIALGAKKSRKRFTGGVLEPGHFIGVEYRLSRSSSLHYLNQAWFLKRFNGIRENYDRLNLALYFLSIVEKVGQEGMDSPDLFNLLGNSLQTLETAPHLTILQFVFEFRLLLCQGVLPKSFHNKKELQNITMHEYSQLVNKWEVFKHIAQEIHQALEHYVHGSTINSLTITSNNY